MDKDWLKVNVDKKEIEVTPPGKKPLKITGDDLEVSYFSGGPGGQNVNKNMNGVRLIYKIPDSHLLPFRKTRELISKSMNQRSRTQNMSDALRALAEKLERYFYVQPERKASKIPKSSKKKRLNDKKMRSSIKQDRKKVDY